MPSILHSNPGYKKGQIGLERLGALRQNIPSSTATQDTKKDWYLYQPSISPPNVHYAVTSSHPPHARVQPCVFQR
jgi:hypothetical protein